MREIYGRKAANLLMVSTLAALLIASAAACGGPEEVSVPAEGLPAATRGMLSPTVAAAEIVRGTPTPYSRGVPLPVVVTATPAPVETAVPRAEATTVPDVRQPKYSDAKDIDCGDFEDWIEAQEFFLSNGGPGEDPNLMDTDMDGIACNAEADRGYEFRAFANADFRAATPDASPAEPQPAGVAVTPAAAVATRTAQMPSAQPPVVTVQPVVTPGNWPTPQELSAVKWAKFRERGYFTKGVSSGKRIRVYEGPEETRYVSCGPEIGTAFDGSNPTWSDRSHWIFFWREPEAGLPGCMGASKYEDWVNKPIPASPPERSEIRSLYVKWGEPLRFAVDDSVRDFSLPDTLDARYVEHSRIVWDDGWVGKCDEASLPWAAWERERGFYTISLEDEEAQRRAEWTVEQVANKEEGRKRGLYFIYKGMGRDKTDGPYCWHVSNHEEIPPHWPCLECQWRGP